MGPGRAPKVGAGREPRRAEKGFNWDNRLLGNRSAARDGCLGLKKPCRGLRCHGHCGQGRKRPACQTSSTNRTIESQSMQGTSSSH